jgi:hypothetical protein
MKEEKKKIANLEDQRTNTDKVSGGRKKPYAEQVHKRDMGEQERKAAQK